MTVLVLPALLCSLFFALSYGTGGKECGQTGKELEKCIKDGLNSVIPSLARVGWMVNNSGIDPLVVGKADTIYHDGNFTINLVFRDVVVVGLASTIVKEVKSRNLEMGKLELMCKNKAISTSGSYQTDGYTPFSLHREGIYNITLSDLTLLVTVHFENYNEYLQVAELKLNAMPSHIDVQVGKSIDGEDNSLASALNLFLNENSFELFDILGPKLLAYFSDLIKDLVNTILMQAPKDSIFPNLQLQS